MVMTALRRRGTLKRHWHRISKTGAARPHLAARFCTSAPRKFVYGCPPHAAINETVAATGREQPFRGLINAVLRRVSEAGEYGAVPDLPTWLLGGLARGLGAEQTAAMETFCAKHHHWIYSFATPLP
ncbi:MAG: hypothetical protein CM15mP55_3600 [Hyphomicrobiales bacterium]|nr:MAG: hypothetical protein CM15mP55_3600 [Hyphomicrobiales bacterium]